MKTICGSELGLIVFEFRFKEPDWDKFYPKPDNSSREMHQQVLKTSRSDVFLWILSYMWFSIRNVIKIDIIRWLCKILAIVSEFIVSSTINTVSILFKSAVCCYGDKESLQSCIHLTMKYTY